MTSLVIYEMVNCWHCFPVVFVVQRSGQFFMWLITTLNSFLMDFLRHDEVSVCLLFVGNNNKATTQGSHLLALFCRFMVLLSCFTKNSSKASWQQIRNICWEWATNRTVIASANLSITTSASVCCHGGRSSTRLENFCCTFIGLQFVVPTLSPLRGWFPLSNSLGTRAKNILSLMNSPVL